MKALAALLSAAMLVGCQPPPDTHKAEIDDLLLRVRVLEQGQRDIVKEMRDNEAKSAAAPVAPVMTYQLEGGRDRPEFAILQRRDARQLGR